MVLTEIFSSLVMFYYVKLLFFFSENLKSSRCVDISAENEQTLILYIDAISLKFVWRGSLVFQNISSV